MKFSSREEPYLKKKLCPWFEARKDSLYHLDDNESLVYNVSRFLN
jgi:hypothetical protein